MLRIVRILTCLAAGLALPAPLAAAPPDVRTRLQTEHTARQQRFAADLQPLIDYCNGHGFAEPASLLRQLSLPIDEQSLNVDELPSEVRLPLPPGLPREQAEWQAPLRKLQTDYAADLYVLSRKALKEGLPTETFHLLRETAFHDPDHPTARRLLGYVRYDNRWMTPFEAHMLRDGKVWSDHFGWLPKGHEERYSRGERYYNGRWMSAEKEQGLRTDLRFAWVVESAHFVVKTNHSLERGVELSIALEAFHEFFVREFAGFFKSPQQIQALFDDRAGAMSTGAKHDVWYLRTREEFVRLLKNKQRGAEMFNGVYMPNDRVAYFFDNPADPEGNMQTMFHEVTHQILGESTKATLEIGTGSEFWVVEGIACYMESYENLDGQRTVGNSQHIRLRGARERIELDHWFIPFEQFTTMGRQEFQFSADFPTLQKYYSQATGMTHFLLHFENGLYRERFIAYLSQLYSPDNRVRLKPQRLDKVLGVPFPTLDRQYQEYMLRLGE